MAEGGYQRDIAELKDVPKVIVGDQAEKRRGKDDAVQDSPLNHDLKSPVSETKNDERDSVFNHLSQELEAAASETKADEDMRNVETRNSSHRPTYDLDRATAELKVVQEDHRKLVAEKNALILALQSGSSLAKDVLSETRRLENARDDLQNQLDENQAQIKAENDAIEELEESSKKDLAETEILKEKARILAIELDRCEEIKMKREDTIKDLEIEAEYKKKLVSNLQRDNESLFGLITEGEVLIQKKNEDICAIQQEINDGGITIKDNIEDELKSTQAKASEMGKKRQELTKTLRTKEEEIKNMNSRLKDIQELKIKSSQQLVELQSCLDKIDEETAIERNKNRALSIPDIEQSKDNTNEAKSSDTDGMAEDDMEELRVTPEEALSLIRRHHNDVLSDFDKQMQAVKRKKPKQ